jgi:hypothetical protein
MVLETLSQKNPAQKKRAAGVIHVVRASCLANPSSNPVLTKQNKKKDK